MYAPHFTPDLYATFTNNSAPLAGRMIVSPVGKLAIPPFPTYPLSTQTNTLLLSLLLLRFFVIKRDIMMFRFRPEIERILSGSMEGFGNGKADFKGIVQVWRRRRKKDSRKNGTMTAPNSDLGAKIIWVSGLSIPRKKENCVLIRAISCSVE